MADFTVAAGASLIWYAPALEPGQNITISAIPETGGTGTVKITTSSVEKVKAGTATWHLPDAILTGWSSGVASVGAIPMVISGPITALQMTATTENCLFEILVW